MHNQKNENYYLAVNSFTYLCILKNYREIWEYNCISLPTVNGLNYFLSNETHTYAIILCTSIYSGATYSGRYLILI